MIYVVIAIIIVVIIVAIARSVSSGGGGGSPGTPGNPNTTECGEKPTFIENLFTPEYKRVGRQGETAVKQAIESVMYSDDWLFTNPSISYDGNPAEMDNVIVNENGVFIIEVKNYVGYIVGNEDDYEWQKFKTTNAGNTFEKTVKNPIRQVKRQVWILHNYLKANGVQVWVQGYALLVQGNSPVNSEQVLYSIDDINRVIHTPGRKLLDEKTVEEIKSLLAQP